MIGLSFLLTSFIILCHAFILLEIYRQNHAFGLNISDSDSISTSLPPDILLPTSSAITSSTDNYSPYASSSSLTSPSSSTSSSSTSSSSSSTERVRKYRFTDDYFTPQISSHTVKKMADMVYRGKYLPNKKLCEHMNIYLSKICTVYYILINKNETIISEIFPYSYEEFCEKSDVKQDRVCTYYNVIKEAKKQKPPKYVPDGNLPYGSRFLIKYDCWYYRGVMDITMQEMCVAKGFLSNFSSTKANFLSNKLQILPSPLPYQLAKDFEDILFRGQTVIPTNCYALYDYEVCYVYNTKRLFDYDLKGVTVGFDDACCNTIIECNYGFTLRTCYYVYMLEQRSKLEREQAYGISLKNEFTTSLFSGFWAYGVEYDLNKTPSLPRGASAVIRPDCIPEADKFIRQICELKGWPIRDRNAKELRIPPSGWTPTWKFSLPKYDAKALTDQDVPDFDWWRLKRRHNDKHLPRFKWRSVDRLPLWPVLTSTPDYWFLS